jgi:thymidylate synthase (FAD)
VKVELLSFTPNGDVLSAAAAKLTHSPSSIDALHTADRDELDAILRHVIKLGHESVVEHASYTFGIAEVSRALTHQLVRHRIASYSQQSQRYVEAKIQYVIPPSIKRAGLHDQFVQAMDTTWRTYDALKQKISLEDARYVLPNATCTSIMVTMNARSLLNFFELRCCLHAQWEIRALAWRMLRLVRAVSPIIFERAGPPCKTRQVCPMNQKSCRWYPKKV